MCGRYASFRQAQAMADAFEVEDMTEAARSIAANWNVAPTNSVRIVVEHAREAGRPRRWLHAARWGLVPSWAESVSIGARMINARAETLAEKPAFRSLVPRRRCLVLADGYYEWRRYRTAAGAEQKQPYYIYPSDGRPFAFAGLYAWWPDPDAEGDDRWLLSTTIITAQARDGLEQLHHREPVMLTAEDTRDWLDPGRERPGDVLDVVNRPGPPVDWHPVGASVGNTRHQGSGLVTAVAPPPELAPQP